MTCMSPGISPLRNDIELISPGEHGDYAMIFDPVADAYYKISARTMQILGYMTERMSAEEFIERMAAAGVFITARELMELLAFLHNHNLLVPEYGQIAMKSEKHREIRAQTAFLRFSAAYLFFRLPPWRVERFLPSVRPYIDWLASKWFIGVMLIPALMGYLLIIRDFGLVKETFADSLSWAGLAKYFVTIICLKVMHESAHVISATHFNCRVRGVGVGFMVFYPRLYTDTTDSWRLPRKTRFLIDGAGIISELLAGGVAALLWLYLPPGAWKSTMFYVFAVSTVSTLFINGNPFIRYDGYYLLCDLLRIENLMTLSSEYIRQVWRYRFLRLGSRPERDNGLFLMCFGIASFLYRICLYTSIILIIYHRFIKALAVVLIFLEMYSIIIYPFWREVKMITVLSRKSANKARWYLAVSATAIILLFLFVPIGWNVTLPGIISPEKYQLVTVDEGGYLLEKLQNKPFPVKNGDMLFAMEAPILDFNIARAKCELNYGKALFELQRVDSVSLGVSSVSWSKIQSDEIVLVEKARRKGKLTVRAVMDGIFVSELEDLSQGAYLPQGVLAGKVVSPETIVYAYADEQDVAKLSPGQRVNIYVSDSLESCKGRVSSVDPIPAKLSNSPLLQQFGGPIPVYVDNNERGKYLSLSAMFRVEIKPEKMQCWLPGRSVKVSVQHSQRLWDRIWNFTISAFRREF